MTVVEVVGGVCNVLERHGPLLASVGRGGLSVGKAVVAREFLRAFLGGQELAKDIRKLVELVRDEFVPADVPAMGGSTKCDLKTFSNPRPNLDFLSGWKPPEVGWGAASEVGGEFGGRPLRPLLALRAFVARSWRRRLAERLAVDGFALVGKDATPYTPDAAAALVAKLTDAEILDAAACCAGVSEDDGRPFLDFIRSVIQWVVDNPDKFLSFLMSILMFFI